MILIVEKDGKPVGAMRVDKDRVTMVFNDEGGRPVQIEAQGSLLPALVSRFSSESSVL